MRGWLVTARKNKDWTQKVVAEKACISRSYYAEIEKGKKTPSGKVAIRLSKVLDLPPDKFFE